MSNVIPFKSNRLSYTIDAVEDGTALVAILITQFGKVLFNSVLTFGSVKEAFEWVDKHIEEGKGVKLN